MQVAVLGTGAMGSRMAAALLKKGHSVTVWNRTAAHAADLVRQGARQADSPASATDGAEVVLAMVRDDAASQRVWLASGDGALARLGKNAIAVESSTLSLPWVRELAAACAARGSSFVDAPVVGSRAQADAAQLIHLVGGDTEIVGLIQPVLAAIGSVAHHVGAIGAGAALKLVVNAMLGVQVALLGELLGSAQRLGLDLARAVEVLAQTPPCSPAAKIASEGILKKSFAPAFPVNLMEKDLGYLLDAITPAAAPVSSAARAVFARGIQAQLGAENMTAVAKLYT